MAPSINPLYPVAEARSIDELMALAVAMEREAAERYEQLAEAMARRGEAELATTFTELAALERDHEGGLGRWAEREGRRRPVPVQVSWQMPETFGDEADGDGFAALTPYGALGIAVRNEERAFTFYTYLAAVAVDAPVRNRAESLAREELNHVSQLRALRRAAFHRERGRPRGVSRAETLERLRVTARALEATAAEIDSAAAAALERSGETAAAQVVSGVAEAARRRAEALPVGRDGEGGETAAVAGARAAGLLEPGALTARGALRLSLGNAREIVEFYMNTAEHAEGEDLLGAAQNLAEAAVGRLAVIRSLLGGEDEHP